MTYWTYAPQDFASFNKRGLFRRVVSEAAPGAIVLGLAVLAGAWIVCVHPDAQFRVVEMPVETPTLEAPQFVKPQIVKPQAQVAKTFAKTVSTTAAPATHVAGNVYSPFIDPTFSLKAARESFSHSAPLAPTFGPDPEAVSPPQVAAVPAQVATVPLPPVEPRALTTTRLPGDEVASAEAGTPSQDNVLPSQTDQSLATSAPLPPPHMVTSVPLPAPRPAGLEVPEAEDHARVAVHQEAQPSVAARVAAVPAAPPRRQSFFQKLFGGLNHPPGQVLAYAEPEDGVAERRPSAAVGLYDRHTAVYDISTHTVYMPDGRRLEAHSGLGHALDDPGYVRQRMRGPTPPGVYDLQPRGQLFHGVAALRLIPVDGSNTFGRNGLLAHTFMLGPRGDSNGCVSFRNYAAFLGAYRSGEITRLAVVAGLH